MNFDFFQARFFSIFLFNEKRVLHKNTRGEVNKLLIGVNEEPDVCVSSNFVPCLVPICAAAKSFTRCCATLQVVLLS